ncbi:LOW QUALITY PROTEIN: beta-1,4-mannosyl-glycoprotein 4-beta-N-acetylglucosaminyltransferase [Ursus americanus]|uniref:LOW QUALITY PROTEIN: beta-1,4-mannosyl-glycoprotein 4-beta-N-acetylglucosaminyltransferase n=1 Tax=Ursus americanus TaxID=9643 RepID=UPI001E67C742|nr:LOW QUALITY PROTEIN: beta-1,4-mannosyl-glycoprotein 4-beta-N-acetylglucosaminyltransferase [Ursus americanus]
MRSPGGQARGAWRKCGSAEPTWRQGVKDYTGTGPSYRIWTLSEGRSSKLGGAALDVAFAWFMGTRPGACRGRPLLLSRMKMRRYKLFLVFCMAGLCLISFLHFFKTLSYVTFPRELASLSPNLVSSFFWNNAPVTPQASPEPGSPDLLRTPLYSHSPLLQPLSPSKAGEELHRMDFVLPEDTTEYFVRTKAGGVCFKPGTKMLEKPPLGGGPRRKAEGADGSSARGPPRHLLSARERLGARGPRRKWVECVCLPGWHGPSCGVPTVVQYSNLPTKERLVPREVPRRVINAMNINHEFDLLDVRFHELGDVVDAFVVCESNFTAYGEPRPLKFREMLTNGTFEYIRHKVLYVFLDHFPLGGRQDGWIADDYLRTFLTQTGVSRLRNLRPDDVFIIDDADEIPARDGVLFLKLYDGWTEPFAFHMRKSLYGFFWKQPGTLEVVSGCTVDMLQTVYGLDGIRLRRRQYYTMPNFRQYENRTGHILVQWSLGSPLHFAGWHCSWCFTPEGIYFKLVSAQNGDFPRWGDYEDKRDLNYIRSLIRTGGWFDGTQQEYPPADPSEHMYAPKYLLSNYAQFRYLLDNPYQEPKSTAKGGRRNRGPEGRPPARGKLDVVEGLRLHDLTGPVAGWGVAAAPPDIFLPPSAVWLVLETDQECMGGGVFPTRALVNQGSGL